MAGWDNGLDEFGRALVECHLCEQAGVVSRFYHQLGSHVKKQHGVDTEEYARRFPGAQLMSATFVERLRSQAGKKTAASSAPEAAVVIAAVEEAAKAKGKAIALRFGVAELVVREGLSDVDASMVPVHDEDFDLDDAALELIALGVQQNDNVLLVGPTGAGKTALVKELAALINQPVRRLNLHGDVRAADFVGEKVVDIDPVTNEPIVMWRDGVLPNAMIHGHWLVLDELDACPAAIAFVMQAVLESEGERQLILSGDHGRVVKAHPLFRIIATANTLGRGDESGMYTGTKVMNEAFLDRFGTVVQFGYMPADREERVLTAKTNVGAVTAANMIKVATMVRAGLDKEECYCTFSTRRLLKWAAKSVALGDDLKAVWRACDISVLNKLSRDDKRYVDAIVQRVFGSRPR